MRMLRQYSQRAFEAGLREWHQLILAMYSDITKDPKVVCLLFQRTHPATQTASHEYLPEDE